MKAKHLFVTILLLGSSVFAAAPPNDSILNAASLPGTYTVNAGIDLSKATADAMDPMIGGQSAGKTVWYMFRMPKNGFVSITIPDGIGVRAALCSVLDPDNPAGSLTILDQTTNTVSGDTEVLETYADQGLLVALMLGGNGLVSFTHRIAFHGNDYPYYAYELSGDSGSDAYTTLNATDSPDEPVHPQAPASVHTVWFKWTPTFDDKVGIDTNFSFTDATDNPSSGTVVHDTVLTVFEEAHPNEYVPVEYDDNSGWKTNSRVVFAASAGSTYLIGVGTKKGEKPGPFHLQYYRSSTPAEIYFQTNNFGQIREDGGSLSIPIRRRYGLTTAGCDIVSTNGGDADPGSDFADINTALVFTAAGSDSDWEALASFIPKTDPIVEYPEDGAFELANPSAGSSIDFSNGSAVVTIIDPQESQTFQARAVITTFRVKEGSDSIWVPIARIDSPLNSQMLNPFVYSGNAVEDEDFTLDHTAMFNANQTMTFVNIGPLDNSKFDPERWVDIGVNGDASFRLIIEDDDPWFPLAGRLISHVAYGVREAVLNATISASGAVTGKFSTPTQVLPFTGVFDRRGVLSVPLFPKDHTPLHLTISAQDASGGFLVSLSDTVTHWVDANNAQLQTFAALKNPCPAIGAYTFIGGATGAVPVPVVTAITVDAAGTAVLAGKVFDGTAFTAVGLVDGYSRVVAMAPLYKGTGEICVFGTLPLAAGQITAPVAAFNRPTRANVPGSLPSIYSYKLGLACRYTPPAAGTRALDLWQISGGIGKATLTGGGLGMALIKNLTFSTANVVTVPADANKLAIQINAKTGIFTGSFLLPGATKATPLFGALVDLPALTGYGKGMFFNGQAAGSVLLNK